MQQRQAEVGLYIVVARQTLIKCNHLGAPIVELSNNIRNLNKIYVDRNNQNIMTDFMTGPMSDTILTDPMAYCMTA